MPAKRESDLEDSGSLVHHQTIGQSEESFGLVVEAVSDYAIFLLDPEGRISTWNRGAQAIKGYSAGEIIGHNFSIFYPPEALAAGWPAEELRRAKAAGRFEDEGWRVRKDGSRFWANIVITALRDGSGDLRGYLKITRDLTERRKQEETLRQSEERFRLLIEGVSDHAIFMLDPEGRVSSWNVGAQRVIGYSPSEIIGRHFSAFYPPELIDRAWPERELEVAGREGRFEDEGWRLRKDGSRFWASSVITALRGHDGRLQGFAKLTRDMTEHRRVESLQEESRKISDFLAMLGHELRNPLAPIANAAAVLRLKEIKDPGVQWARAVVERQVGHLSRIVDDLLDVSRITRGLITLKREPLELSGIVASALEGSRPLIEKRRHLLEVRSPEEPILVEGDFTRLTQVLLNLLVNAAKYTPEGGRIRLTVEREGEEALVRVADTGIGIPPELLPRVFDLFTQGDRSLDRSEGGIGVGLTLARRLVEMHHGSIEARSPVPGGGSEFIVRLPVMAAPPAPEPSRAQPGATSRRRRILVVDDNRDSAESLGLLLRMIGHDSRVAHDGEEALAVAESFKPELILLDIGLPIMSGFEVAERIREIPALAETVLVAMTGYGNDEDKERSRKAGFQTHLVKPVDPARIEELLLKLFEAEA